MTRVRSVYPSVRVVEYIPFLTHTTAKMAEASSSTAPAPAAMVSTTVVRPEKMDEATYSAIQQYRAVRPIYPSTDDDDELMG